MASVSMKDEVRRAIRSEWPTFERQHPRLAAVLDESLLVEGAIESIADDPEYRETMATAQAMGLGASAVTGVVHRLVGKWLQELL